jgi:CubicO group peptidase (beta-lactamase class C family)
MGQISHGSTFKTPFPKKQHRIVAREWVKKSVANQVPISAVDPYSDFYGYMWYSKGETVGNRSIVAHFASGNGGNKIYIVPTLDIVVAVTSSAYHHHYGQVRSQDILLKVLSAAHR